MSCPWSKGSQRRRFYRPDWYAAPDCVGCLEECEGRKHRCHVFGLPGFCQWPNGIMMSNHSMPWWYPDEEPSLAESWLR